MAAGDNDGLARVIVRLLADSTRVNGPRHPATQALRDFLESRP